MRRLIAGQFYGWTLSCIGVAIGHSDPFWLICAVGCLACAVRLHIGSIAPDRSTHNGIG